MKKPLLFSFLVCCSLTHKQASAQIITTVAGSGTSTLDSVQARTAKLNQPYGVAVDANGNVYVADYANNKIRKVDASTGKIYTIAGTGTAGSMGDNGPAISAQLSSPTGVAVDASGNVYVADKGNNRIRKIDASTKKIYTFAGTGTPAFAGDNGLAINAKLNAPYGVAVDAGGNVYIAEWLSHRIRKVSSDTIRTIAGGSTSGNTGDTGPAISALLYKPTGVAVDASGNVYIADNGNNRVRRIDAVSKNIYAFAGTGGAGFSGDNGLATSAKLNAPYGVAADANGNVYIADGSNNKIRKVTSDTIRTIAGTINGYYGDSVLANKPYVKLSTPMGVAAAANGNVYIADYGNNRIRAIVPYFPAVSIAASQNNICIGTPVTYTATPTKGGSAPAYQWMVNGTAVGTGATYSYVPANGDVVNCVLTSNDTLVNPATATSNTVTMVVNTTMTPAVSIVASQNNFCSGTPVIYTATPTNGGTTPAYQWTVNGSNAGTGSDTLIYTPGNGDVISCELTSGLSCANPGSVTSNSISMTVTTSVTPAISIATPQTTICAGTTVTYTATPTNGGTTPAYQWTVNGSNVGTGSDTLIYTPVNGDVISCELTSSASCASIATAASNSITMTVNPIVTPTVSIAATQTNICSGTTVTYTATATDSGSAPTYQWMVNGTNVGPNSATFNFAPGNGNVISCMLTSNATCAIPATVTSNSIAMSVTQSVTPAVYIIASQNNVCSGTSVLYQIASSSHGGSAPYYQWKVNGATMANGTSTFSYAPALGDVVNCELTSNATCANPATVASNNVAITVKPTVTPTVSISSQNNVCAGTQVTYSATSTDGGVTPVYQWLVNGANAGTGSTYSYTPANSDVISCVLTSNASCATPATANSNDITMTVNPTVTPALIIAPSQNNICKGTQVTYTAMPTNGGGAPAYQWKVNNANAGTNSNTFSYVPANGDVVNCMLNSNAICANPNIVISNNVTMVANTFVPVVTVAANPGTTVTEGQQVVFTANATNAGANPQYKWFNNGVVIAGATQASYTAVAGTDINNNDQISVWVKNTDQCGDSTTSNTVTIAITTGVKNIVGDNNSINLYPNPNDGSFIVKAALVNKEQHTVTVEVCNTIGQTVYKESVAVSNGVLEHQIELSKTLPSGNYFLKLSDGENSVVRFTIVGK